MQGLVFELGDYPGRVEAIEQRKGFKGLMFQTNKQQFIEAKSGMKGIEFNLAARGSAIKIQHFR